MGYNGLQNYVAEIPQTHSVDFGYVAHTLEYGYHYPKSTTRLIETLPLRLSMTQASR